MASSRLSWHLSPNKLSVLLAERRSSGSSVVDLTESNPTRCGIAYPGLDILSALATHQSLTYEPAPSGPAAAREAVAQRWSCAPDDVLLTASTSEAYAYLFKVLCDPGDAVLAPCPSYPLFELLGALEGIKVASYPLRWDGAWHIDLGALTDLVERIPRLRAILLVSPNNPTGSYLKRDELHWLCAKAAEHDLALISDEVFAEYPLISDPTRVLHVANEARVLAFGLGGLSKSAGLPQMKLGWIVAGGPDQARRAATQQLELVADNYLSVSTPIALAAPRLLELGDRIRGSIHDRVTENHTWLASRILGAGAVRILPAEGGWYATLRFPATRSDEDLALDVLRDHGVLVHPGFFFDYPQGTWIVISCLCAPADFRLGVEALLETSGVVAA